MRMQESNVIKLIYWLLDTSLEKHWIMQKLNNVKNAKSGFDYFSALIANPFKVFGMTNKSNRVYF